MTIRISLLASAALLATACSQPAPAESPAATASPSAAPAPTAQAALSPAELTAMIQRDGGPDTVVALLQAPEDPRWLAVLNGISSGEQAWLDTIPLMGDGLDGEAAGSVSVSLSDALEHNAAGVLRIAAPLGYVEDVCFPMPPADNPGGEAAGDAQHARKIAAVEAVADPALRTARAECLAVLRPQ